jgi:anti-anti-sigma factor
MATRDTVWGAVTQSIEADRGVVVSLSDAEFIDSGAIYALFRADQLLQERGRRLAVHFHTASAVRRTLEVTNVCDSLPCFGDVETALASASARGSEPSWSPE